MSNSAPVALISGAAKRIGAETARALHQAGYSVVIHYRNSKDEAETLCQSLNAKRRDSAVIFSARLEIADELKALANFTLESYSRCDVLINNASAYYPTPLQQATEKQWDELFASNAKAPYFLSQHLAAALRQRQGVIINIADINAERPKAFYSIYCMAKAANVMMTKALALELAPEVRVNGISPGAALWPESEKGKEIANEKMLDIVPMKALGGSESIVEAIMFLVEKGRYITGQCLSVDGGRTLLQ